MASKKKLRKKELKARISKKKRKKLKLIVEVLSERGCRDAKFEIGTKESEFTTSELEAFCELHGYGLYGFHENQICVPSQVENGMLYMKF